MFQHLAALVDPAVLVDPAALVDLAAPVDLAGLVDPTPKSCRSHELRSGIMYTTCDCIKRNGLQDKCPRSQCQGRSACMCLPTPNCCPSAFPLRFANMTMGVKKRRGGSGGCSQQSNPSCPPPCGPCDPCCGPSNPMGGAPSPIPCSPSPQCCPPLPEAGIPDPRIWNVCNTPPCYPCGF
ncbi:uncharacterized protein isoform X2 [Musca autumnalis]|uniref:uncharacterized protein isoform X2 n=1 Tax=Musca autumnalis TaxID=221902 RepID=UPI003CF960C7